MIVQPEGGYTTADSWTGISSGLNPQYSPSVYNNKTQPFMQQSMIPRDSWVFNQQEIHVHRKNTQGKFFGRNGQSTDVSNESVAQ